MTALLTGTSYLNHIVKLTDLETLDLSSVRHYTIGGVKPPSEVFLKFKDIFPNGNLCEMYGMSELSAFMSISYPESREGSAGRLVDGIRVKIIGEDGNKCGINEPGVVHLKYVRKLLGYYRNPQANAEAFDEDGWFVTGDVGYLDEDGFFFYQDRKSEIIRYNG